MKQHETAVAVVKHLKMHILDGGEPVNGYLTMAHLICYDGKVARAMGQVMSRIDAACFNAGLPMLGGHWVRNSLGKLNEHMFDGGAWESYRDEIISKSSSHVWANNDFDNLMHALNALPKDSAVVIWSSIVKRDAKQHGFILYNLHRQVN